MHEEDTIMMHVSLDDSCNDLDILTLEENCSLSSDLPNRPVNYYVHIHNGEESTYNPCKRNVPIDPNFQAPLQ